MGQPFTRVVALFTPEFQDDGKATWATYEQGGQVGAKFPELAPSCNVFQKQLVNFYNNNAFNITTFRFP